MNFLSQYMSRFGRPSMDNAEQFQMGHPFAGMQPHLQGFQAHTGGPGQMMQHQGVQTGGGLPPMAMPQVSTGGGLPPMQGGMNANTGGGLPAMLGGLHANTGGYDAPQPMGLQAHTGGGMQPQAQGFGLRGLMDWGRRMGGRSY